jgi:hypothetical protein
VRIRPLDHVKLRSVSKLAELDGPHYARSSPNGSPTL